MAWSESKEALLTSLMYLKKKSCLQRKDGNCNNPACEERERLSLKHSSETQTPTWAVKPDKAHRVILYVSASCFCATGEQLGCQTSWLLCATVPIFRHLKA